MSNSIDKGASRNPPHARPDTLERLLAHCAAISPQKTALVDPPNRNQLEGRSDNLPPRRFTFQTLDEVITKLAIRLGALGLREGDYIGLQLPNFIEAPILVLASMRAGLIPCMLPLSWSSEEVARSFERLKPSALISCGQLGDINYSYNMRELAFSHLHVRFVMGAGYDIAEGVSDLGSLFDPSNKELAPETPPQIGRNLTDLTLVTYIDPITPVPHNNGQILSAGLLHVLEFGLSSNDHILSAYPLSSIPGLVAHMYPWLLSGCSLSLHHPFEFNILQEQLQSTAFDFFAAPEQVIEWLLRNELNTPAKLAMVRRKSHLPANMITMPDNIQLFELWNLGGLGAVPVKHDPDNPSGLFIDGQICLPSTNNAQLCLAAAKISADRLFIKGRIFPGASVLGISLEWISLKKRFDQDWLDTGLAAFHGPDNSILLGGEVSANLNKIAS